MTPDDWDRVVQVNLSGAFYLSRAILQHMLDRGSGRIINISSIIGESGNIGQANYAAAKAGLFGLTMSLAQETARKGITVNSVAPGYISTEMVAAVPKEALDKVVAKIPVGRLGDADEVARVVEFLADPDSAFITGQIYSRQRRPVHVTTARVGADDLAVRTIAHHHGADAGGRRAARRSAAARVRGGLRERHVAARLRAARAAPGMGRGHGDRREPRARHLVSRAGPSRRLAPPCQRRTCDVRRARLARG